MTPIPENGTPTPTPAKDQGPYWDWSDAALFLGMAPPTLGVALLVSKGLKLLLPAQGSLAFTAIAFQFSWYALWFTALYWMLRMKYDEPFLAGLGWKTTWPGMKWTLFLGPMVAVAVILIGAMLHTPEIDNPIQKLLAGRWQTLLVGAFATMFGPVAEELGFRGFLLPLMMRSFGVLGGVALCSGAFVALHGPQYSWSWQHLLLLFLASIVFSLVRVRTGSTAASAMVHATYNLTFFTGYLIQERDRIF